MLKRLDTPLLPLLITAITAALFVFGLLRLHGFNASAFVTAGDKFCDPALVPPDLIVLKDSQGFDGQFYYRLALDPFTSKRTDFGITLDIPALRHQRVLYPLLARALSFGNNGLVPAVMILINFGALCLLGWLGGLYAQSLKQHALWGIVLPLYPGSLLTLTRDLVELTEVSLLLGSLLLLRRGRYASSTLLLSFAILAKETALLVAVAALLVYIVDYCKGRNERIRWYYFAIPLAVFSVWQLTLFSVWGELPVLAGRMNLGVPFAGFAGFLADASAFQTPLQRRSFPELIFLIGFAASVIYCLRSTAATLHEKCSWLLYTILALTLSRVVWVEDWAYLRAVTEFCVIGSVIILASKSKIRIPVFGCAFLFWLFMFVRLLRHGD